ncbi:MAG: SAM-dependent methyltransferase [Clostridia bacterium]|nr:SAM-dependent methyltransferase [Clostridia bacterium]
MVKLSKRLQQIADFVPLGTKVADIGTDHGLLPCYLVQKGVSPLAIAADISKGPLKMAERLVSTLLLADRVELRLGDGLKVLNPGEVDTVVIAGMGGATIKNILEASPKVVEKLKRLILQPNVAGNLVRLWAKQNQWRIIDEEIIFEDKHYYEIIVLEPGEMNWVDDIYLHLGPKLVEKHHPLLIPFLQNQEEVEQEILKDLKKSNSKEAKQKAQDIQNKWAKIRQVITWRLNVQM